MGKNRHQNLQDIPQGRKCIEQILKQEFRKKIAILLTGIYGYTEYINTRGDISGRILLRRYNSIVLPLIEKHEGKIIEIIGDAVMAAFSTPLASVKASIAIQKAFLRHNENTEEMDKIYIKMGIHFGKVLVEKNRVYRALTGDVLNVSSCIRSEAKQEQILISKDVYEEIYRNEDLIFRFYKKIRVKGKIQPMEIYQVLWQDNDIQLHYEAKSQFYKFDVEKRGKQPLRQPLGLLQLEITLHGDCLKISVNEKIPGEESTIRQYEELPVSMDVINAKCHKIVDTLNKANRKGCVTCELLAKLRENGQILYDELFSLSVKERLKNTNDEYLSLKIDDHLVQIPWELLHDGQKFLCQRFHMGRLIKTRQSVMSIKNRALTRPLKMLILADPEGDLKGAYTEGTQIRDYMDKKKDLINASFRSEGVTPDFIKEKIRNFEFVHFAGHADYNPQNVGDSGWRLSNGSLKAKDIIKMAGTNSMPTLIFSNSCQSARTEEWGLKVHFENEILGLTNAFLLTGVKHYIGTLWEISDEQSSHFSLEFYKYLLSGVSIGEAISQSRFALIKNYGEENIIWASYILYGDPTFNYREHVEAARDMEKSEPFHFPILNKKVRVRDEAIDFSNKGIAKKNRLWLSVVAAIAILITLLFWGYQGFLKERMKKYEKTALTYYNKDDLEGALHICGIFEEKDPEDRLSYSVRGNNHSKNGKQDLAGEAYQKGLQAPLAEELKSGTKLTDRDVALSLGRMLAARLILSEHLVYLRPQAEVSIRLIETEAGQIVAVINESFESVIPLSDLTERLSKTY